MRFPQQLPKVQTLAVLLALCAATALFVPTVVGYVSYDEVETADVAVSSASLADDDSTLRVTLEFTNPTRVPVEVFRVEPFVRDRVGLVNSVTRADFTTTTVPPGETGAIEVRIPVLSGLRDRALTGLENDSLTISGELKVRVRGVKNSIRIEQRPLP
jgi:hypothetical protein